MIRRSNRLVELTEIAEVQHVRRSAFYTLAMFWKIVTVLVERLLSLSTVLAQDHFFSDSLSLHLTSQTHKVTMRMFMGAGSWITSPQLHAADLMTFWSSPLSEWPALRGHQHLVLEQMSDWIPFGDHPLKLERYRED